MNKTELHLHPTEYRSYSGVPAEFRELSLNSRTALSGKKLWVASFRPLTLFSKYLTILTVFGVCQLARESASQPICTGLQRFALPWTT